MDEETGIIFISNASFLIGSAAATACIYSIGCDNEKNNSTVYGTKEELMDKSDVCMMAGTTLVMAALIMWETFGLMITPTVMTVAAGGCFVAAGLCSAREEELRSRKRKRR